MMVSLKRSPFVVLPARRTQKKNRFQIAQPETLPRIDEIELFFTPNPKP
jgi:hypothetical protein